MSKHNWDQQQGSDEFQRRGIEGHSRLSNVERHEHARNFWHMVWVEHRARDGARDVLVSHGLLPYQVQAVVDYADSYAEKWNDERSQKARLG